MKAFERYTIASHFQWKCAVCEDRVLQPGFPILRDRAPYTINKYLCACYQCAAKLLRERPEKYVQAAMMKEWAQKEPITPTQALLTCPECWKKVRGVLWDQHVRECILFEFGAEDEDGVLPRLEDAAPSAAYHPNSERRVIKMYERECIAARQGWRCPGYCKQLLQSCFDIDHRIPHSLIGDDVGNNSNLQALCPSCHSHKTKTDNRYIKDYKQRQKQVKAKNARGTVCPKCMSVVSIDFLTAHKAVCRGLHVSQGEEGDQCMAPDMETPSGKWAPSIVCTPSWARSMLAGRQQN